MSDRMTDIQVSYCKLQKSSDYDLKESQMEGNRTITFVTSLLLIEIQTLEFIAVNDC